MLARHRRRRLHRLQLRARLAARTRRAGRQPRQAHLRRQPRATSRRCAATPRHVFVRGDIGDRALRRARCSREHRPRAIVHFAAESHVDRSIHGPAAFVETNVVGTFDAARGGARLLGGAAGGGARRVPLPARLDRRGLRLARRPTIRRSPRRRRTRRTARTRRRRRRPTTWCAPTTTPTACRR